jgi:Putative zinc-finger
MKHSEAWKQLDDYLDHELSPAVSAQVEAHLMHCADCRQEIEYKRGLVRLAGKLPREQTPSRDLWAGIAETIGISQSQNDQRSPQRDHRFSFSWKPAILTAALAASLMLIIGISGRFDDHQATTSSAANPLWAEQSAWGGPGGIISPAEMSPFQALSAQFALTATAFAAICTKPDSNNCEAVNQYFGRELDLIDSAIAEARGALTENPYSQQAMSSLITMLKRRETIQLKALQLIENSPQTT